MDARISPCGLSQVAHNACARVGSLEHPRNRFSGYNLLCRPQETARQKVGLFYIYFVSNKNLNTVSFDETIECEIIDNSDAKNGHYWVSNGSSRFEAYSEKNSYTKGSKVLVKIPRGDYRATKYIEGLVEREDG